MENVDNDLQIIEHDPLACRKTVNRHRPHGVVFSQTCFDFVGDSFQLWLGRGRANHEKICKRRDCAQIEDNDLLRLFI